MSPVRFCLVVKPGKEEEGESVELDWIGLNSPLLTPEEEESLGVLLSLPLYPLPSSTDNDPLKDDPVAAHKSQ